MSYFKNGWSRYEWEIREIKSSGALLLLLKQHSKDLDAFDWVKVLQSQHFSNEIFKLYEKEIPWEHVSLFRKVPIEYLDKHFGELDIFECSLFQSLTASFIKKYKDFLSLDVIVKREDLDKDARDEAQRLFKKCDDSTHHMRWDQNLAASSFCPKNFKGHYTDYQDETEESISTEMITPTAELEKKNNIKPKKSKQQKIILDYSTMKKAELKSILEKRNVRVFYHDTLEILIRKCKESEAL